MKLKLDLHDIYTRGEEIERALQSIMDDAVAKKAPLVEIIPGKGSGQLKKRLLRFLDRKQVKALYHRVERTPTTGVGCSSTSAGSSPRSLKGPKFLASDDVTGANRTR